MKRALILSWLVLSTGTAWAQAPSAPSKPQKRVWSSCAEHIPKGATRPELEASLPDRGTSGYETRLTVIVTHGPGETVLDDDFKIQRGSDAERAITQEGFSIPDPLGASKPRFETPDVDDNSTALRKTTVSLPFVPLPKEPGRHVLTLPPVPLTVARSNGEVMTVCTPPQTILVEDPIANEPDPEVKGNPEARVQREEWLLAKRLALAVLAVLGLSLLMAYFIHRARQIPKPEPVKPKVLPWIWAMRQLHEIKQSGMILDGDLDDYFDQVSLTLRDYLGRRYGFDGVESTSAEIRAVLSRVYPPIKGNETIDAFLEQNDFIKFAEVRPSLEECEQAMERAMRIINTTTPALAPRVQDEAQEAA